jgi:hypothetical protein
MRNQKNGKHDEKKHKGWKRLRRRQDVKSGMGHTEREPQPVSPKQANNAGVIRPDTVLHLSSDLREAGDGQQASGPPRVMLVIITLALTFIAIIAYMVSQMPKRE